jgi:hypothetical protein
MKRGALLLSLVVAAVASSASSGASPPQEAAGLRAARAWVLANGCDPSRLICGGSRRCSRLDASISNVWNPSLSFNALYGNCRAVDDRDQHIWFFVNGRFVGTDSATSSREIVGLWRDSDTIAFLYVLYRRTDGNCCPTGGGRIVRFRWNGTKVRALDRIPPDQSVAIPLGR